MSERREARTGDGQASQTVWVCYSGCVHEGGGVPHAIYSNREAAEAWLQDQLAKATESARLQREFEEARRPGSYQWDDEPKWYGDDTLRGFTVIYDTHMIKQYAVADAFQPASSADAAVSSAAAPRGLP